MNVVTESHNVISRKSRIAGAKNIVLSGRTLIEDGVVLRGDVSSKPIISLGKWCCLRANARIEPPKRGDRVCPQKLGSFVYIGERSVVRSAQIGSHVVIGENCDLGEFSVIKDGSIVAANTKVPRYAVVDNSTQQPESSFELIEQLCKQVHAGIAAQFEIMGN